MFVRQNFRFRTLTRKKAGVNPSVCPFSFVPLSINISVLRTLTVTLQRDHLGTAVSCENKW